MLIILSIVGIVLLWYAGVRLLGYLMRRRVRNYFGRMLAEMIRGLEEEERQTEPQITQINTDFLRKKKKKKEKE